MFDLTLQIVIFRAVALLPIAAVHGAAIAGTAGLLGDRGPRFDGRLTLSPIPHLDLVGSLALVAFGLGWIRPVAINPAELKGGRAGLVLIAAAGIAADLVLAVLLPLLRIPALNFLPGTLGLSAVAFLDLAAALSIAFAVFNLIPLPPLTAGLVLHAVVPAATRWLDRYAIVVVIVLAAFIVSGLAQSAIAPLYRTVSSWLLAG
jgi:Zn-dependent protease